MNESYFKDFANRLSARRDDLDISHHKITSKTNLKKEWISHIESGNFEFAPEVYIKGILRQYAKQIQIDPDEAVREYEQIREKINFIAEERFVEVKSFDARTHFSPREIVDFLITGKREVVPDEGQGLEAEVKKKLLQERKINLAVMSGGLLLVIVCLFYVFFDSPGRPVSQQDKKIETSTSISTKSFFKKARWELSEPILTDEQKFLKVEAERRMEMDSIQKLNNFKNVSLKKNEPLEPISVQEAAQDLEQRISN